MRVPLLILAVAALYQSGCGKKSEIVFFPPASESGEDGGTVITSALTASRLRLAGRTYLASTIREALNLSAVANPLKGQLETYLATRVEGQISPMGGASCDPNRQFAIAGQENNPNFFLRQDSDCPLFLYNEAIGFLTPQGGTSTAEMVPFATSGRMALTVRACDRLLRHDEVLTAAAAQIGSSLAAFPTAAEQTKVFQLFFPGRTPPDDVLTALDGVAKGTGLDSPQPKDGWWGLFAVLCYDPHWQIP